MSALPDSFITVWPCDHGNVLVEHGDVPLGASCAQCGAHPVRYVAVDVVKSAEFANRVLTSHLASTCSGMADAQQDGIVRALDITQRAASSRKEAMT